MKKFNKKLVLATSSKPRAELIKKLNVNFLVFEPNINEGALNCDKPDILVRRLSFKKAIEAKKKYKNSLVLAFDTIVYARKSFFFKTIDHQVAYNNLKKLSGRRHTVYTGITSINNKNETHFYLTKTKVKFKLLDEFDINIYLKTNEWKNKAGSYAIQGYASSFVSYISGSYTNVVGLPMEKVYHVLKVNNFIN